VVVIFIARPISVFATLAVTNFLQKKKKRISLPHQIVLTWGGIRGALAAAVVLLIPAHFQFSQELQIATAGVILTTFALNATTMPLLLRKLKIDEFSLQEKIQRFEAEVLLDEKIKSHLAKMLEKKYISKNVFDILEKKYSRAENEAIAVLQNLRSRFVQKSTREIEKALNFYALGIEKKVYRELFENREISEKKFLDLHASIDRQTRRLNSGKLPRERKFAPTEREKISGKICGNRFLNFISPRLCQKLEKKIQTEKICERIQHFRARRIASWEVVLSFKRLAKNLDFVKNSAAFGNIIEQYEKWSFNAEEKLKNLRRQFPEITNLATTHFAENSCLNQARKLKNELLAQEFISNKVAAEIEQKIEINKTDGLRAKNF